MSQLSISLIELLVKGVPEGLLVVLAVFILTKTPFDKKKYALISILFIIITYLIRLLPINFGVNTMIGLLILVLLFVLIVKTDVPKLIKSTITILITLFVCEEINVLFLYLILGKEKLDTILSSPMSKALYGTPSTILFGIAIYVMYRIMKKKDLNTSNI